MLLQFSARSVFWFFPFLLLPGLALAQQAEPLSICPNCEDRN